MAAFVISGLNEQYLDTPVFYAGARGEEEAVAVFTHRPAAEAYLEDAGWGEDHRVEELTALELLRWLVHADQEGARYLTVNPDRSTHLAGRPQPVLVIEREVAGYAEQLTEAILRRGGQATRQVASNN